MGFNLQNRTKVDMKRHYSQDMRIAKLLRKAKHVLKTAIKAAIVVSIIYLPYSFITGNSIDWFSYGLGNIAMLIITRLNSN